MTVTDVPAAALPATTTSPSGRQFWRAARLPLVIVVLLGLIAVLATVLTPRGPHGALDPDGVDPAGSHALATLLRERGIAVERVTTAAAAENAAHAGTTLLVTAPAKVPTADLSILGATPADLVVLAPSRGDVHALGVPVDVVGAASVMRRAPDCTLRVAELAGTTDLGGVTFRALPGTRSIGCYPAGGDPTLVRVIDRGRSVTLVGTGEPWTNQRLDHRGNAALGLDVLGAQPRLTWLVPSLAGAAATAGHRSLLRLLPHRLLLATGQLAIAVLLLALWRARRLGPVVVEPLPVVVRAAETVEGRARLYHAARSRDGAADALRAASRLRISTALGLPSQAEAAAVTTAVAAHTTRSGTGVSALLYGAAPDTEAALIQLAADLDDLDREVRST